MPDPAPQRLPDPTGTFVAVVGPSGAGKDTILAEARRRLADEPAVRFARRVVTREAQADAEDHDTLDEAGFARAEAGGAFCLTWRAHGLAYGIPAEHLSDCRRGATVVANVSRRSLADAARAFGGIEVVEITAEPRLLAERIAARGRESAQDVAARLKRQVPLVLPDARCRLTRIDNSRDLESAVATMLDRLRLVSTARER